LLHQRRSRLWRAQFAAVAGAVILGLTAPVALAQETPHGTIAWAKGRKVGTISADGTGKTILFDAPKTSSYSPSVSPDGTMVMFTTYYREPNLSALFVSDLQTGDLFKVAGKKFDVGTAVWSHDGSTIAFVAYGEDKRGLWTASPHGTGKFHVYGKFSDDPTWSNDDSKLAFVNFRRGDSVISYWDFNTNELYDVPPGQTDLYDPQWSPDDELIAYTQYDEATESSSLHVVDAQGQEITDLTSEGSVFNATWNPDGSGLTYSNCCVDGSDTLQFTSVDGSETQTLFVQEESAGINYFVSFWGFSDDGSQMVFESIGYDEATFRVADYTLYTANADGSGQSERSIDPKVSFIDWAPDSDSLLVCSYDYETGQTQLLYIQGEAIHPIMMGTCSANWGA
jgi:Tol biopolymer transport system component